MITAFTVLFVSVSFAKVDPMTAMTVVGIVATPATMTTSVSIIQRIVTNGIMIRDIPVTSPTLLRMISFIYMASTRYVIIAV